MLIFKPPLSNGMSATSALGEGLFRNPAGLELDPSGGFWVNDNGNNQFLFFPFGSTQPTKVLGKRVPDYSGACDNPSGTLFIYADGRSEDAQGLRLGGRNRHRCRRRHFRLRLGRIARHVALSRSHSSYCPNFAYPADKRIFLPLQYAVPNHVGPTGFNGPNGVAVAGRQLILAEAHRLMFWNDTSSLTNGQPADGCLGNFDSPDCLFEGPHIGLVYGRINADQASHLWVIDNA